MDESQYGTSVPGLRVCLPGVGDWRERCHPKSLPVDGLEALNQMNSAGYEVAFSTRRVVIGFVVAALFLLVTHSALTIYHYSVEEVSWLPWRQLFDVDEENNLPTWFSGFLLSVVAFFVWLCARRSRSAAEPWADHWYGLAVGFLLLSLDEVAGMHETVNSLIDMSWAIPGGIIAGVIGLAFVPFLRRLPGQTALLFLLAGGLYIGGAVGVEIIGEPMDSDTMLYNLTTVVEEGMEMAGVILFLHALLSYMNEDGSFVEAAVSLD